MRLSRFYETISLYGGTYILFVALEFSLYETLLRYLETNYDVENELKGHSNLNILLSGAFAGSVAGFVTNFFETVTVKAQTSKNFSVYNYLRQPGALKDAVFRGARIRTIYYGLQAIFLFFTLEKGKEFLKVDHMED